MKLIIRILLIVVFIDLFAQGRKFKSHRKKRRTHDEIDLPVLAHATAYDEVFNEKTDSSFFSSFEHIYENEKDKKYKVTVGITKDPLPGESDALHADKKSRALIVVFRGTANLDNVLKDLKYSQETFGNQFSCDGCLVHEGIFQSYAHVKVKLFQKLTHVLNEYRNNEHFHIHHVIFTGHSLGGAMANLGAYNFCIRRKHAQQIPDDTNLSMYNVENVSLITFGAPRVGNPLFKSYVDNELGLRYNYRVIYGNDPITGAPPKSIGEVIGDLNYQYLHAGTEIRYEKDNFIRPSKGNRNEDTCANESFRFLDIIKSITDIKDHTNYKRINYRNLWQCIVTQNCNNF
jgi:hypothetical protein